MSENSQIATTRPLLSIVIPTKDRYEYLIPCLEILINLKDQFPEIEIVIQDNTADNTEIIHLVKKYQDIIVYHHISEKLSVVDNCNNAIANSSGEYVCMLGDDDSVTSFIVDVCKWMKENNVDACLGKICRFNWPDMVFTMHKLKNLTIPSPLPKNQLGLQDSGLIRRKVLLEGGISMLTLPKVYHAVVARSALQKVKELSGSYFPGPSPDMANAIGLTFTLKKYVIIDTPIIISGFSYKSAGGAGTRRAHVGKIEDITHLPDKTKYIWNKRIPRYWTGETIYAESIIEALQSCKSRDIQDFSFNAMYGSFAMYHTNLIGLLRGYVGIHNIVPVSYHFFKILMKRSINYFKNIGETRFNISSNIAFDNVKTLNEAIDLVEHWAEKFHYDFSHRNIKL